VDDPREVVFGPRPIVVLEVFLHLLLPRCIEEWVCQEEGIDRVGWVLEIVEDLPCLMLVREPTVAIDVVEARIKIPWAQRSRSQHGGDFAVQALGQVRWGQGRCGRLRRDDFGERQMDFGV